MIEKLKKLVIENKDTVSYINLDEKNAYVGWVSDFHICFKDGRNMNLNLNNDKDMFMLYVLAVAWSRTGRWENAAYFVTYLKYNHFDEVNRWCNKEFVNSIKSNSIEAAKSIDEYCDNMQSRIKVSFRKDIYDSVYVLANHWSEIMDTIEQANADDDYIEFITYMRGLKGLGTGNKTMNIKILLILRELRCQKIYSNIPGELCCIPDERVKNACAELNIKLPSTISKVSNLVKASTILYENFGDLYDIPPFAYNDLKEKLI